MKYLFPLLLLSINTLFSQSQDFSLAKTTAKVEGIYIFYQCEPQNPYTYLGNVRYSTSSAMNQNYLTTLLKIARKKYKNFHAIILRSGNVANADVIAFNDLELQGMGFSVGDKCSFIDQGTEYKGEIIAIDNNKQAAKVKYTNSYGKEYIVSKPYVKLQKIE